MNDNNNNNKTSFALISSKIKLKWHDKTKGLSKLVIIRQCVSHQWMDEDARKLRWICSIKMFLDVGGMKLY